MIIVHPTRPPSRKTGATSSCQTLFRPPPQCLVPISLGGRKTAERWRERRVRWTTSVPIPTPNHASCGWRGSMNCAPRDTPKSYIERIESS